jgi:hypothetical protein
MTYNGQRFDCRIEISLSILRRPTTCMQDLPERDEAIQCVMHAAGGYQWPRQIGAHFPVDANDLSRTGPPGKSVKGGSPQFDRPSRSIANREAGLTEGVHPFGEIMEILTVPIPLQALVERFADSAFPESFADPQATGRRWCRPLSSSSPLIHPWRASSLRYRPSTA